MKNKRIVLLFLGLSLTTAVVLFSNSSKQVLVSKTQEANISPSVSAHPSSSLTQTQAPQIQRNFVKVAKVIDGDTIQVFINGKTATIRLIGIDTPETVEREKPVHCLGIQASEKAKEILGSKSIRLEPDATQGDKDKYGRLLRFVFLEDGTNFNELLIREGYAYEYTYSVPYKYQMEFKAAEKDARDNRRGLWSKTACSEDSKNSSSGEDESSIQAPVIPDGKYACDCTKLCSQIKTCDEAYYQLNNCGCTKRDADSDGVPCESLCR